MFGKKEPSVEDMSNAMAIGVMGRAAGYLNREVQVCIGGCREVIQKCLPGCVGPVQVGAMLMQEV